MKNPHLAHQTQLSRTGSLDMSNRKPYRTKELKALARQSAVKCADGTWRSDAPVLFHKGSK